MGRSPCCDKMGIKKGPWTPEEDIILVSYIQEHGPGNWRSVPTSTGLMRCSKSCRLRWTNYLRPGIKRGNFTQQEEGTIIQLQTLLGNKWAAIASYLPQRTDNDIKNYWNTHLKKKLKKLHAPNGGDGGGDGCTTTSSDLPTASSTHQLAVGRQDTTSATAAATSRTWPGAQSSSTYASSTENISKLLETWMSPPSRHGGHHTIVNTNTDVIGGEMEQGRSYDQLALLDDTLLSLDNMNRSTCSSADTKQMAAEDTAGCFRQPPFPMLEKWMLDDSTEGLMEWSSDCCSSALF